PRCRRGLRARALFLWHGSVPCPVSLQAGGDAFSPTARLSFGNGQRVDHGTQYLRVAELAAAEVEQPSVVSPNSQQNFGVIPAERAGARESGNPGKLLA